MESINLPTENRLDGSFLNISFEQIVHTSKYDSYQCDICQKKFKSQHNLETFKNPWWYYILLSKLYPIFWFWRKT